MKLEFKYNDGGRGLYFKGKDVGDCVTRAIAIASGLDYKYIYDTIFKTAGKTPRTGVKKYYAKAVMKELGFVWHPLMGIGSGCKAHLAAGEIPMSGRIVCAVSRHYTAVIDGVINDTFDPSRGGTRCVYGYYEYPASIYNLLDKLKREGRLS